MHKPHLNKNQNDLHWVDSLVKMRLIPNLKLETIYRILFNWVFLASDQLYMFGVHDSGLENFQITSQVAVQTNLVSVC